MADVPVAGQLRGDVLPHLIYVDDGDTAEQMIEKVCHHVVGMRLPERDGVGRTLYFEAKPVSAQATFADLGLGVMDYIEVRYDDEAGEPDAGSEAVPARGRTARPPQSGVQPRSTSDAPADAEDAADAETQAPEEAQPEEEPEPKAEPGPDSEPHADAQPQPDSQTLVDAQPQPDSEPQATEEADVWVQAASLDEVWEGEVIDVEIDGEEVILVRRRGGDVVAYQGACPHQEQPLVDGEVDEETTSITCPAHSYEFDLRDGSGINPTGCHLYRYRTKVEDSKIFVGYDAGDERCVTSCD